MAKAVKLELAVEGTAFTKQGKQERSHKSPLKKQSLTDLKPALGKRSSKE
jgi:hypothetical protein